MNHLLGRIAHIFQPSADCITAISTPKIGAATSQEPDHVANISFVQSDSELACLLVGSASLQSTFAQSTKQERKQAEAEKEKIQEKAQAIFKAKPLAIDAKEDEIQRLLKERFNNATQELETQFVLLDNDLATADAVGASIHRWTKAGLEVAEEPAAQLKILEMQIVVSKFLELICATKFKGDTEDLAKVLQAKNLRITAEVELLRMKKSLQVSKGN